jgi:hypothetical protein
MTVAFDEIRQDLLAFQTKVKAWKEDDLEESELDTVSNLVEQTVALLIGDVEGDDDSTDEEDDY